MSEYSIDRAHLLEIEIRPLIQSGVEGDHWDFKEKHHSNKVDLVHDIICLANNMSASGHRYLIFGIKDDGEIVGLADDDRKSTVEIVQILKRAKFAGDVYPDVELIDLNVGGLAIQVLQIADHPEKPYYLQSPFSDPKPGKTLRAGTIYSRTKDRNTGRDETASTLEIERMWQERFGLSLSPMERMRMYLRQPTLWESQGDNYWYFKQFPEFTVQETQDETYEVTHGESWVRSAINPKAFVRPLNLMYHQTNLARVVCIYYDEMRHMTSAPRPVFTSSRSSELPFYAIVMSSLDGDMFRFLRKHDSVELFGEVQLLDRLGLELPVLIFQTDEEKELFVQHLQETPIRASEIKPASQLSIDPSVSEHDVSVIAYCDAVLTRFEEWKIPSP